MNSNAKAETATYEPSIADDSPSEHIYIGSDDTSPAPAATARKVRERITLNNALRRARLDLTIYEEGFLGIAERRYGQPRDTFRLDLHYLDPVPTMHRVIAVRWFYATLVCAATAALAAFLGRFEILRVATVPVLIVAGLATVATLFVAVYRSYEKTEFRTIHGRAAVLSLIANLGSIRRFRAFVPKLCSAIEESAEQISADTSAYLRGEMREHYRLRGDGVLSTADCAESTGRILAQFDVRI